MNWTNEEINYLKLNYGKEDFSVIKNILKRHSERAIYKKVQVCGLQKNNRWTENEINYLKANWGKLSVSELKKVLKRHKFIYQKAFSLGIVETIKYVEWTKKDDEFLLKNYKTLKSIGVAKHLNRKPSTVRMRYKKLVDSGKA